jgi:DNA polymerase III gamma/tau subunit
MRDALSILDQCTAYGGITMDAVTAALGSGDLQLLYTLAACISDYNEKGALEGLRALLDAGADTRALIKDLADIFRRMMWLAAGADDGDDDGDLKALAERFGKSACIRALNILIQKEYEMRQNLRADIVLETAVMALMAPEDDTASPPAARLDKLEARLRTLEERPTATAIPADIEKTTPVRPESVPPKKAAPIRKSAGALDAQADALWKKTLEVLRKDAAHVCLYAQQAKEVLCVGDVFEIKFGTDAGTAADFLKHPKVQESLEQTLSETAGRPFSVSIIAAHHAQPKNTEKGISEIFGADNIEIIQED